MTVTETTHRVNYSETDQMGVVYHANYAIWLDVARTEHLRASGMSYAAFESRGFRLAVSELHVRYRQPARFDDLIRVRCWVEECASRRVRFAYRVERVADAVLLATADTALLVLDEAFRPTRLPADVAVLLPVTPAPLG